MRIRRPEPTLAARQAEWVVAIEPWLSLGYKQASLARYLRRMARARQILIAQERTSVLGILVFQPDFLLGRFIALLAVRPEAGGQGIGRALVAAVEKDRIILARREEALRDQQDAFQRDSKAKVQRVLDFVDHEAKRLVSICASGGRVLNLLQDGAEEVWAVDVNPSQTHLLELKVAGMRALDHADFLSFMGVRDSQRRLDVYDSLRPALSAGARDYFDCNPGETSTRRTSRGDPIYRPRQ